MMVRDQKEFFMQVIKMLQKPPRRFLWMFWFLWTGLILYLMLAPDEGTGVDTVSSFFGASEITDAIGHAVLLFVESMLSFSLLSSYIGRAIAYQSLMKDNGKKKDLPCCQRQVYSRTLRI